MSKSRDFSKIKSPVKFILVDEDKEKPLWDYGSAAEFCLNEHHMINRAKNASVFDFWEGTKLDRRTPPPRQRYVYISEESIEGDQSEGDQSEASRRLFTPATGAEAQTNAPVSNDEDNAGGGLEDQFPAGGPQFPPPPASATPPPPSYSVWTGALPSRCPVTSLPYANNTPIIRLHNPLEFYKACDTLEKRHREWVDICEKYANDKRKATTVLKQCLGESAQSLIRSYLERDEPQAAWGSLKKIVCDPQNPNVTNQLEAVLRALRLDHWYNLGQYMQRFDRCVAVINGRRVLNNDQLHDDVLFAIIKVGILDGGARDEYKDAFTYAENVGTYDVDNLRDLLQRTYTRLILERQDEKIQAAETQRYLTSHNKKMVSSNDYRAAANAAVGAPTKPSNPRPRATMPPNTVLVKGRNGKFDKLRDGTPPQCYKEHCGAWGHYAHNCPTTTRPRANAARSSPKAEIDDKWEPLPEGDEPIPSANLGQVSDPNTLDNPWYTRRGGKDEES